MEMDKINNFCKCVCFSGGASSLDKKHTYWKRSLKYLSQFRTSISHPDNLGKESVLYSFQVFAEL